MTEGVEGASFTYEDLDRLVHAAQWSDAMQRLPDVPTADRPKHWDSVVEKVVTGYLSELIQQDRSMAEVMARELLKTYPALSRSKPFRALRNQNAFEGFTQCFSTPADRDECTKRLADYAKEQSDDPQVVLRAGRLVGEKHRLDLAFPFFYKAVSQKTREVVCVDPLAQKALFAALTLPQGETTGMAQAFAEKFCWAKIKSLIQQEFDRTSENNFIKNTCPVLKAKGALKGMRAKRCLN